jgi:hypothetical protein
MSRVVEQIFDDSWRIGTKVLTKCAADTIIREDLS